MKPSKMIIMLLLVFFVSASIIAVSKKMADAYSVDISNDFMGDIDNTSSLMNEIIDPMAEKTQAQSDISVLVGIGANVVSAVKLLYNIPTFFVNLTTALIGIAPVPAGLSQLINAIVLLSIVFAIIYLFTGREL